jgi:hypothetical protein
MLEAVAVLVIPQQQVAQVAVGKVEHLVDRLLLQVLQTLEAVAVLDLGVIKTLLLAVQELLFCVTQIPKQLLLEQV